MCPWRALHCVFLVGGYSGVLHQSYFNPPMQGPRMAWVCCMCVGGGGRVEEVGLEERRTAVLECTASEHSAVKCGAS